MFLLADVGVLHAALAFGPSPDCCYAPAAVGNPGEKETLDVYVVLRRMALSHFSLNTVYTWLLSVCSPTELRNANANRRSSLGPLGEKLNSPN